MSAEEFNYHQMIEEYLLGAMTSPERLAFEKELEKNSALQQEVNAHRLANDIVIERRLLDVKATLKIIDKQASSNGWKWMLGAGLGLVLLGGYYFSTLNTTSPVPVKQPAKTIAIPPIKTQRVETQLPQAKAITASKKGVTAPQASLPDEGANTMSSPVQASTELPARAEIPEAKTEAPVHQDKTEENAKKPVPIPVDPCKWVTLSADISTHATCQGKSEGIVRVAHIKGGTLPYKTALFDERNQESSLSSLSKGTYTLVVTDNKGCSQRFEKLKVATKVCSQDLVFNPSLGESWEIPDSEQDGTLKIYDNAGTLYFWKEIQAFEKEHWSGRSMNGEQKQGYFLFEIQYKDGSSAQGSITLVK